MVILLREGMAHTRESVNDAIECLNGKIREVAESKGFNVGAPAETVGEKGKGDRDVQCAY